MSDGGVTRLEDSKAGVAGPGDLEREGWRLASEDPAEDARLEAEHGQETQRMARMLEEKGFGMEGDSLAGSR